MSGDYCILGVIILDLLSLCRVRCRRCLQQGHIAPKKYSYSSNTGLSENVFYYFNCYWYFQIDGIFHSLYYKVFITISLLLNISWWDAIKEADGFLGGIIYKHMNCQFIMQSGKNTVFSIDLVWVTLFLLY